jgi:DNA-binding transcriptional LysR family regulator
VELRQLRYFATLSEELHFGRAAAREHIVSSALSQQIQRLERELGVSLVERSTHHVRLTARGELFLVEVRRILGQINCAVTSARTATAGCSVVRVAIGDASLDSMPQVLRVVQHKHPRLEIHQIEAGVPEQLRMLVDGRLDVGFGGAMLAPADVASEVLRLDPVGVLVAETHPLACATSAPVALLAGESLLLPDQSRAPEFNQFVTEMCRIAGFTPAVYRGTVQSMCAAAQMVAHGCCVVCAPCSCRLRWPNTRWVPLVDPVPRYPWSLLWRARTPTEPVDMLLACAREVSGKLGWIEPEGRSSERTQLLSGVGEHTRTDSYPRPHKPKRKRTSSENGSPTTANYAPSSRN